MSFYRPSSSPQTSFQSPPNFFLSSPPTQQSPLSPFQHLHSQQSPHSSSSIFFDHHRPFSQSNSQRKSEGFEPMNTSPISTPLQLHLQHQPQQYLPSFLTGDRDNHMTLSHNLTVPEPSIIFEDIDQNKNTNSISTQSKPAGPPVTGLGELSGIGNLAATFEQNLAAANTVSASGGLNLTPSSASPPWPISGNWVTIFGFPASATTYVVTNFSQFGTIVETKANPGSNWLHLKYSNKIEARRALNRNGTVIGGSMMIGVIPYDDSEDQLLVVDSTRQPTSTTITSPTIRENMNMNTSLPGSSAADWRKENQVLTNKNRIRSLAKSNASSLMNSQTALPKENSGVVARVVDYMFGW